MHDNRYRYNLSNVQGKSHLKTDPYVVEMLDKMSDDKLKEYIRFKGEFSYDEWIEIPEDQFIKETESFLIDESDELSDKILNALNLNDYCCIREDGDTVRFYKKTGDKVNYEVISPYIMHYLHKRKVKL